MAHLAAEAATQPDGTRPRDEGEPSRADQLAAMGAEFVGGDS